jgi:hypothetical protein
VSKCPQRISFLSAPEPDVTEKGKSIFVEKPI